MMGLNTAFKKVYGELLEPYGFKKLKGRNPYFVRMVGDEIVHVITCTSRPRIMRSDDKQFDIFCGVATVYRDKINLDESASNNFIWLDAISSHYLKSKIIMDKRSLNGKWYTFSYEENNEESLIDSMKYTAELTRYIILPIIDRVYNIENCYSYFRTFIPGVLFLNENEFEKGKTNKHNEGIIYTKIYDIDQFILHKKELYEKFKKEKLLVVKDTANGYSMQDYENDLISHYENIQITIERFKSLVLDSAKLEELFQTRKRNNLEILKKYGIEVDTKNLERLSNMTHPDKIYIPEELL